MWSTSRLTHSPMCQQLFWGILDTSHSNFLSRVFEMFSFLPLPGFLCTVWRNSVVVCKQKSSVFRNVMFKSCQGANNFILICISQIGLLLNINNKLLVQFDSSFWLLFQGEHQPHLPSTSSLPFSRWESVAIRNTCQKERWEWCTRHLFIQLKIVPHLVKRGCYVCWMFPTCMMRTLWDCRSIRCIL